MLASLPAHVISFRLGVSQSLTHCPITVARGETRPIPAPASEFRLARQSQPFTLFHQNEHRFRKESEQRNSEDEHYNEGKSRDPYDLDLLRWDHPL
jgi:hypothetical protein